MLATSFAAGGAGRTPGYLIDNDGPANRPGVSPCAISLAAWPVCHSVIVSGPGGQTERCPMGAAGPAGGDCRESSEIAGLVGDKRPRVQGHDDCRFNG